jgi:Abnormal spindle-like microcephaly-assoc'd, ASPM-SPD-2-Hydin
MRKIMFTLTGNQGKVAMRLCLLTACLAVLIGSSSGVAARAATVTDPVTADVARLDFGNVTVGTTTWLNVTFTNNTSSVVGMTGGGVTFPFDADFDGSNCVNVGLAPGASCTLAVSFTPTANRHFNGTVFAEWSSSSAVLIQIEITLSGHGDKH